MDGQDHARDRVAGAGHRFTPPASWRRLPAAGTRWSVWYVDETGSTNADLLAAAEAGAPEGTVLATGHQTAGRGRLDRQWEAPPGENLLVSVLFRDIPPHVCDLTHRVGIAAVAAVRAVAGVEARLKWPNDLMLDGRKLAGILAQGAPDGPVVVGLGLNVGWAPQDAARLGPGSSPIDVLSALLVALDAPMPDPDLRYRELLATLGSRVRVVLPTAELVGTAVDVQRDGTLVVIDACAITHRVEVGDVVHLRDEAG